MRVPSADSDARRTYRRALEALRSGVPNHDAVGALGCSQPEVERRFAEQVAKMDRKKQVPGILVAGGFGSGKSHLLEFLERSALESNCVCSRIVISKETPLYDLGKVYRAAIDQAIVPGRAGQAIQEICLMLQPRSGEYAELYRWANAPESALPPFFPATLLLHERLRSDPELVESITGFWAGDRLRVARVKQGLRQVDAAGIFEIRPVPVRDLGGHRFTFMSQLIAAAGFRGWVLLIDEVELIGRYSPLQRGRAYAEVARWMGHVDGPGFGGLSAVLAITDDFAVAVLHEKNDRETIGPKLRGASASGYAEVADRAEVGMVMIERDAVLLVPPDDAVLAHTYQRLKEIHSRAYGWEAPDVASAERSIQRSMRSYVRRWIAEWDLKRFYPNATVDLQEEKVATDYAEDLNLETTDVPDDEE